MALGTQVNFRARRAAASAISGHHGLAARCPRGPIASNAGLVLRSGMRMATGIELTGT
jgi:hypothetical protein